MAAGMTTQEISPGRYDPGSLPPFDSSRQTWQATAYYHNDHYYGDEEFKLWKIDNVYPRSGDTGFVFSNLVLGMSSTEVMYKIAGEHVESLDKHFEDDQEALLVLEGLRKKVESQLASYKENRLTRMAEIISNQREQWHALVSESEPAEGGRIEGRFAKLWGLARSGDDFAPTLVLKGRDGKLGGFSYESMGLWLYRGKLEKNQMKGQR